MLGMGSKLDRIRTVSGLGFKIIGLFCPL